jgi:hypothetical protein
MNLKQMKDTKNTDQLQLKTTHTDVHKIKPTKQDQNGHEFFRTQVQLIPQ